MKILLTDKRGMTLAEVVTLAQTNIRELIRKPLPSSKKKLFARFEFEIESLDLLRWLSRVQNEVKIFWAGRDGQFTAAAAGVADRIKNDGAIPHSVIVNRMQENLARLNPGSRYYGGLAFDAVNISEEWQNFGTYQFILPRFELTHQGDKTLFACTVPVNDKWELNETLRELQMMPKESDPIPGATPVAVSRCDAPQAKEWQRILNAVFRQFEKKLLQKIVLARQTTLTFNKKLDPFALAAAMKESSHNCFLFLFQFKKDEAFLGASPERLYRRENKKLLTEAIAGTRPRGALPPDDGRLSRELLTSTKDLEEHRLVVKDIQERLRPLCVALKRSTRPQLLTLKAGHHLITPQEGKTTHSVTDAELLAALHPTPAVAGTPTGRALIEIKKREPFARGWYAGPVGFIGSRESEFAVAIRSGLCQGKNLQLYAGAGIVPGSTAQNEWEEIEHKLSWFLSIFNT